MKRHALAATLALSISLAPSEAHAGWLDDLAKVMFVLVVVVGGGAAVVETVTGVATYKNFRSRANREDASAFWVGAGGVGGLANIAVGGVLVASGLPESHTVACPDPKSGAYLEKYTPTATPGICTFREPASTSAIVFGSVLFSFGALALGSSIAAATGGGRDAAVGGPGKAPAMTGLSLPVLTF